MWRVDEPSRFGADGAGQTPVFGGSEVRKTLASMHSATSQIIHALAGADSGFDTVVVDDARKSLAALDLVLGQSSISSELIDNLNASIHLRALLTDLFLVSEATN